MDKKTDVRKGVWWAVYSDPDGHYHTAVGFVVANTEHYLTLSPDKSTVGNDIVIPAAAIIADGPCICATSVVPTA
jgi:hypothetical protein